MKYLLKILNFTLFHDLVVINNDVFSSTSSFTHLPSQLLAFFLLLASKVRVDVAIFVVVGDFKLAPLLQKLCFVMWFSPETRRRRGRSRANFAIRITSISSVSTSTSNSLRIDLASSVSRSFLCCKEPPVCSCTPETKMFCLLARRRSVSARIFAGSS